MYFFHIRHVKLQTIKQKPLKTLKYLEKREIASKTLTNLESIESIDKPRNVQGTNLVILEIC